MYVTLLGYPSLQPPTPQVLGRFTDVSSLIECILSHLEHFALGLEVVDPATRRQMHLQEPITAARLQAALEDLHNPASPRHVRQSLIAAMDEAALRDDGFPVVWTQAEREAAIGMLQPEYGGPGPSAVSDLTSDQAIAEMLWAQWSIQHALRPLE